jgi:hypothetical protein
MMRKNWREIGQVTVIAYNNSSKVFRSLADAVLWLGEKSVMALNDGRLGVYIIDRRSGNYTGILNNFERSKWSHSNCYGLSGWEDYVLYDEIGLRIPAWRVKEEWRNLPWVEDDAYPRRYYLPGRRFGHKSNVYPRTKTNLVSIESIEVDTEEAFEHGFHLKARRHSGCFDKWWYEFGPSRYKNHNWKNYRRTQYKCVDMR